MKAETDTELADATGVGVPWLMKWKLRDESPNDRTIGKRFAEGLRVEEDWLFDGVGDPPEKELWRAWSAQPSYLRAAARYNLEIGARVAETKAAPKRSAATGKKPKR